MDMEEAAQGLVQKLIELGAQGYYIPAFMIRGQKIYTQEIGNVNPKTASSMLMYLFDQKTKEVKNYEQGKERTRSRRSH